MSIVVTAVVAPVAVERLEQAACNVHVKAGFSSPFNAAGLLQFTFALWA